MIVSQLDAGKVGKLHQIVNSGRIQIFSLHYDSLQKLLDRLLAEVSCPKPELVPNQAPGTPNVPPSDL